MASEFGGKNKKTVSIAGGFVSARSGEKSEKGKKYSASKKKRGNKRNGMTPKSVQPGTYEWILSPPRGRKISGKKEKKKKKKKE